MFLVEAECAAFHLPSDTALGGSQCLSRMFNGNIYFLNQPEALPALRQESKVAGTSEPAEQNTLCVFNWKGAQQHLSLG